MIEKRFTVQRIYKGMDDGVKYYDWCVMKNDEIILCLTTRMDCKDVVAVLNDLSDENEQLKRQVKDYSMRNTVNSDLYDETYEQLEKMEKNYKSLLNENEQLKHNNKMLSMKMSEVYTKYCLLKEFSEDTNPNDAVKRILSELMQITKEYR